VRRSGCLERASRHVQAVLAKAFRGDLIPSTT
jgi:hypothetical protein